MLLPLRLVFHSKQIAMHPMKRNRIATGIINFNDYSLEYTQLKNALDLRPRFSMEFAQENGFADTWHIATPVEDLPYSGNTIISNTVESLTLKNSFKTEAAEAFSF